MTNNKPFIHDKTNCCNDCIATDHDFYCPCDICRKGLPEQSRDLLDNLVDEIMHYSIGHGNTRGFIFNRIKQDIDEFMRRFPK
jgi:hypothetical protein